MPPVFKDTADIVQGVLSNRLKNFRYYVQFPGISNVAMLRIGFSSITGLSLGEVEEIEYREGTDFSSPTKYPGQTSFGNITFERGVVFDLVGESMEGWFNAVTEASSGLIEASVDGVGRYEYLQDIEVFVTSKTGIVGRAFILRDAWIKSYNYGDLSGDGNDIWLSTMEIVHHGMIRHPDKDIFNISITQLFPTT